MLPTGVEFATGPWWMWWRKTYQIPFDQIRELRFERSTHFSWGRLLIYVLLFGFGYGVLAFLILRLLFYYYAVEVEYILLAIGLGVLTGLVLGFRKLKRGHLIVEAYLADAPCQLVFKANQAAEDLYAALNNRFTAWAIGAQPRVFYRTEQGH